MLLYPERGLELGDTAAQIAELCRAPREAREIVEQMVARYAAEPRARVEAEVMAFLRALDERGLLLVEGDGGVDGDAGGEGAS